LARPFLDRLHGQRRWPIRIVEEFVLPGDGLDVGMLCHHPERIETLWPSETEGVVGAQPTIVLVKPMIGVGRGINQRRANLGRKIGFVTRAQDRTLWFGSREDVRTDRER